MISRFLKPRALTACIATCLAAGGLATQAVAFQTGAAGASQSAGATQAQRYIVRFTEAPLALHNRELAAASAAHAQAQGKAKSGLSSAAAIPVRLSANGRPKLDTQSANARAYRQALGASQASHRAAIERALGRQVTPLRSFQLALNGSIMELSASEANKLRSLDGIASVQPVREVVPMDDVSSRLIGASSVWIGSPDRASSNLFASLDELVADLSGTSGFKGDGMVVGDIDTGINSLSPSFAATDVSGYVHNNPLGAGNYIGDCSVKGISFAGCNDKVIGVFDEYNRGNGDDPVSVEDVNGHGSHTASTEIGNPRSGGFPGYTANISGISPHSNLVFFGICPSGSGCSDAAIIGAVEDAIDSRVVDVLNLSFGNGAGYEPDYWQDGQSLAFLAATDAGIFVAQSAGNTQASGALAAQAPGTTGNDAPWVTTVAASTTTGDITPLVVNVTGPGTPPASLQNLSAAELSDDTSLNAAFPNSSGSVSLPVLISPQFHISDTSGSDACKSFPAGTFAGVAALVSRGTCTFGTKVLNAQAAGAIAVFIADNRPEAYPGLTAGGVGVPVFYLTQSDAGNLQTFMKPSNGKATVSAGFASARLAAQPDVLAGFSLIGPALLGGGVARGGKAPAPIDLIKPDIAAPGVQILAVLNNARGNDAAGNALPFNGVNFVGFDSGTSMAAPHVTAAGALVMGVHPTWTPMQVKSALMMTAVNAGVTKADGATPADPFDVGAGRVQVYSATKAGLVLDESTDNLYAADPASGGDPSSLNLASMQSSKCGDTCTFTRTFTSTLPTAQHWTVNTGGALANQISVTPSDFTVGKDQSVTLTINVATSTLQPGGGYRFGSVSLLPDAAALPAPSSNLPALTLPVAVAVAAPKLAAAANAVNIDLQGKASGSATLALNNLGGGTMVFGPKSSGFAPLTWVSQPDDYGYNGWSSVHYLNPGSSDNDFYAADDFAITGNNVDLGRIVTAGQVYNHSLASFGSSLPLHWRIYADSKGLPSSDPVANGPAVWSYDATAGSPGVSVAGDAISLNLTVAKLKTGLSAGNYWLVVYPDLPCNDAKNTGCTEGWFWNNSWYGSGQVFALTSSASGAAWSNKGNLNYGSGPGLAMTITTTVGCGALPGWLTLTPNGGEGSATASTPGVVQFSASAAGYAPSTSASTYVCFDSGYQEPTLGVTLPRGAVPVQVNAKN